MYECWLYLPLVHINLPDCDITDDSLLNVRVCVLCVLTPASFLEKGTNLCCSLHVALLSRPLLMLISCTHSCVLLTIGRD